MKLECQLELSETSHTLPPSLSHMGRVERFTTGKTPFGSTERLPFKSYLLDFQK
jgi:male-specific lethal 1